MGKYDLFVNLHQQWHGARARRRSCALTFRHAVLLNQRKILLSQRSHAGDEAEYAGMVAFAPLDGLAAAYRALAAASVDDRRARARARTTSSARNSRRATSSSAPACTVAGGSL